MDTAKKVKSVRIVGDPIERTENKTKDIQIVLRDLPRKGKE